MRPLPPLAGLAWAAACAVLAAALYGGYRAAPEMAPFVLRTVNVEGNHRAQTAHVLRASRVETGVGLFAVDVDTVRTDVERLPWVKRARVLRQLPSTLVIAVEEWEPRYLVRLEKLCYLSAEAHLIEAPLDQGLDYPVVTGLSRRDLEEEGPLRAGLLELLLALQEEHWQAALSEVHGSAGGGFTVYTEGEGSLGIHLGWADFGPKLDRLQQLQRHLKKRRQNVYAVDLDYTDKIIARLGEPGGKD